MNARIGTARPSCAPPVLRTAGTGIRRSLRHDGTLVAALRWGGSGVERIALDGSVGERIVLPVTRVTSCTFGGADLGDLYVTTARGADPGGQAGEPLAGALFRCRPGVRGMRPARFAG